MQLEPEGYRVTTVPSGLEALSLAAEAHFDLFVLSILLPDMNGIELCRQLRAFDKATPILFFTVHDDLRQEALDAGAQDLIVKPTDYPQLLERIARWARK